jgi:AcrR family transcriptional regulator
MAELAERAGVRKASLFHHFPGKEAIYVEVLTAHVAVVKDAITRAAALPGSYAERLDAMGDAIVTVLGAHPCAARLLTREVMDWGPVVRGGLSKKIMVVLGAVEAFVRDGQEEGAFVEAEPRQLILSVIALCFMPFVLGEIAQRFAGAAPTSTLFAAWRREAVRLHVRRLLLAAPAPTARRRRPSASRA